MGNLQAVYYRSPDGSEPVSDFIDRMSVKRQVVLDSQIDRLNMPTPSRPSLPSPHSSQVKGELRELRCHYGRESYRVLYRRSRNLIVLLHIFRKHTGKVQRPRSVSPRSAGATTAGGWTPHTDARPARRAAMLPDERVDRSSLSKSVTSSAAKVVG